MFNNPKLWRIVGFVLSTVGLICYALSSYFQYLYGRWNILKMTIYTLVSLTISRIMLFAQKLQGWRCFGIRAHVVFLVLMLTSLYSVFYDKTMDGKPDALGIISNGAFSLMSLSLSRQIQLGFEAGMSNFFLGCLTVQLMKISLMLTSAAAVFCYLVIVVRSHLNSRTQVDAGHVDANNHMQNDITNIVARGADSESSREGANTAADTANEVVVIAVAGDGADSILVLEESYTTRTIERQAEQHPQLLIDRIAQPNESVTLEPTINADDRVDGQTDAINAVDEGSEEPKNAGMDIVNEAAREEPDNVHEIEESITAGSIEQYAGLRGLSSDRTAESTVEKIGMEFKPKRPLPTKKATLAEIHKDFFKSVFRVFHKKPDRNFHQKSD